MKNLTKTFAVFGILLCTASYAFAQALPHATIYFWMDKRYSTGNAQLALNNNEKTASFRDTDLVEYKIYSHGKVKIQMYNFGIPLQSHQFDFQPGKKYYLYMKPDGGLYSFSHRIESLDSVAAQAFFKNKTYFRNKHFYEEDIKNPIVPGSLEQFALQGPRSASAFLLSKDGYIVTNHHVIDQAKKITIKGINGDYTTSYSAKIVANDKNNDIAILQLENKTVTFGEVPYKLRSTGVETGEEIYTLGYPLINTMGEEIKLTTGVISAKTGYQGDITSYQVSAPVQPGNSGGPLFDKQGNLVGIINAKVNGAENASYAIKNNYLNTLLDLLPTRPDINQKSAVNTLTLQDQVKSLSRFVYIVEVNK